MKLDLDQLRELIRLLDESNLTEIEVEHDDDRIRVRREPTPMVGATEQQSVAPSGAASRRTHPTSRLQPRKMAPTSRRLSSVHSIAHLLPKMSRSSRSATRSCQARCFASSKR